MDQGAAILSFVNETVVRFERFRWNGNEDGGADGEFESGKWPGGQHLDEVPQFVQNVEPTPTFQDEYNVWLTQKCFTGSRIQNHKIASQAASVIEARTEHSESRRQQQL